MNNDNSELAQLLGDLGFSTIEALTYTALLELEAVSIRKIAAKSGINRGTTYDAIKRLVSAGLVSTRKVGAREYFTAESPEKVYDLIRDKRKDLLQAQQQAQRLIPELLARKGRPLGRPLVKYYQDDEGVVTILRDVLQTCGQLAQPEYYVYSSQPLRQYIYRKFPQFTDRRIREGIAVRVIAIGGGGDPAALSDRKWLTEAAATVSSSYTLIYGNKVATISISNDNTPYGVVIEDSGNAAMQQLLFEQLWVRLA